METYKYYLYTQADRETGFIKSFLKQNSSMSLFVGKKDAGSVQFKQPDILTIIPLNDSEYNYCVEI